MTDAGGGTAHRKLLLQLVAFAAFLRPLAATIYLPSLVPLRDDLATTTVLVAATITVYNLALALAQIAYGPLVDRFDARRVLLAGVAVFGLGSLAGALAPNVWVLLVARVIQAAGIGAAGVVGMALVSDLFPARERGSAMGTFQLWSSLGASAGPLLGAAMALFAPWEGTFLLLALASGGVLLLLWRALPAQRVSTEALSLRSVTQVLSHPPVLTAFLLGAAVFYGLYVYHALLPFIMDEEMGLSPTVVGLVLAILPLAVSAGSVAGGRLTDRWGSRTAILAATALAFLSFGLFALEMRGGQPGAVPLLLLALVGSGFAVGANLPPQMSLVVGWFPRIRGTASGVYFAGRFLGSSVGPLGAALLLSAGGYLYAFGSSALLFLLGLALAAAWVRDAPRPAAPQPGEVA